MPNRSRSRLPALALAATLLLGLAQPLVAAGPNQPRRAPNELVAAVSGRRPAAAPADNRIGVYNYTFDPLAEGEPPLPADWRADAAGEGPGLHLVQFGGPIEGAWLANLEKAGLRPLQYYAHNAYLVWGTAASRLAAESAPAVRWTGAFHPAYKISPALARLEAGPIDNVAITLYDDGALDASLAALQALGGAHLQHYAAQPDRAFYTAIFHLDSARLAEAAALPTVWAIDYSPPRPGLDDEIGDQIVSGNYTSPTSVPPGYQAWLALKGINGSGITWADVDTGLDGAHPDITGRVSAYLTYPGAPAANTDPDGHGSHTAGAIFGDGHGTGITETAGVLWGTGLAPSATLVVQNVLMTNVWPPAGGYNVLSRDSVLNGAIGSNNSWFTGASGPQGYSAAAREHDLMVRDAVFTTTSVAEPIILVFSAGNAGPGGSTLTEPKEAKNLIVVGNSHNYPRTGADINGLASSSSRGPALDGRLLPNVVAPGSQTVSFRSSGSNISCSASPVAGAGAPYYSYCTGTSMAAPFASGAAVLIADWWQDQGRGIPSPAMVKALLVNGAADMAGGAGVGGNLPNNNQGWGRLNLNNVIAPPAPALYFDQATLFTDPGQSFSLPLLVPVSGSLPVKISLVWSDAPGGIGVTPNLVNDLNLEVTAGASLYHGNVFANGLSTTGGSADALNNLENVFLPAGGGAFSVSVQAANVAGDGVPYNGDTTDQDFALVIYNAVAANQIGALSGEVRDASTSSLIAGALVQASLSPTLTFSTVAAAGLYSLTLPVSTFTVTASAAGYAPATVAGASVVSGATTTRDFNLAGVPALAAAGHALAETAGNGNGFVDQGETYALSIGLTNLGFGAAAGVTGTLALDSGDAVLLDASASYGAIAPGATITPAVPLSFRVGAGQLCGQPLTFTFTAGQAPGQGGPVVYPLSLPVGASTLGVTQTFTSTNVPIAIPDNNAAGITSTLNIAASGLVGDVDVRLTDVTHGWVGDLSMQLLSPGGAQVSLMNRPGAGSFGSSGNNFVNAILDDDAATAIEQISGTGPFTGAYRPDQPLASLNGGPNAGAWRLRVQDNATPDTGSLNAWSLDLREWIPVCASYTEHGVSVNPPSDAASAAPGAQHVYSLRVENTGNITDTYTVSAGPHQWPLSAPAAAGPLTPGAYADVPVTATVPLTASGGALDAVTLTFTSQADGGVTANATLTTTALVATHRFYLPAIFKDFVATLFGRD
ncbi:MAG: S8 family serine peptidase [Anaerolineales bacterium]|nr:S8 family serine peptidase [Anaerolineales bacterium]